MVLIISCILFLVSILVVVIGFKYIHTVNTDVNEKNNQLKQEYEKLQLNKDILSKQTLELNSEVEKLQQKIIDKNNEYTKQEEEKVKQSKEAFNSYYNILEEAYKKLELEYDEKLVNINNNFNEQQNSLNEQLNLIQKDIKKMKATRDGFQQAIQKEQLDRVEKNFYTLNSAITDQDKEDIQYLQSILPKLNKPRILNMLIWQTFVQKPLKQLSQTLLGSTTTTGIYKITNLETNQSYIGQAVDIAKRWNEHAKCGLGIDTPPQNKLYKAMQEYGIWNFSWELIVSCPKEELNEKEKFYIEIYDSVNTGYNSIKGVSK